MTAVDALKLYKEAKADSRTSPHRIQYLWEQFTELARKEMEQKSDGESNMVG